MIRISRPASRHGEFSIPFKVLLAVALLLIVVGIMVAISQPKLFSFSESANMTIFDTMKDLGGLVTP